jgi:hypothetical protein
MNKVNIRFSGLHSSTNAAKLAKKPVSSLRVKPDLTRLYVLGTDKMKILGDLNRDRRLIIVTDNGKFCGGIYDGKEALIDKFDPYAVPTGRPVAIFLDHHNPVPVGVGGKVSSELVLHYSALLRNTVRWAKENKYQIITVSHSTPFDPDAMISQWLVKKLIDGSITDTPQTSHIRFAQYAKQTDFYQHVFSSEQHLTLRGICDGLAKRCKSNWDLLVSESDKILDYLSSRSPDPNDFNAFKAFLEKTFLHDKFPAGSVESLIKKCIIMKQDALTRAERIINEIMSDPKRSFDVVLEILSGEKMKTKILLIDDPLAGPLSKELDDIIYSNDGLPPIVIKRTEEGQWWGCMRPSDYITEKGKRSDPVLKAARPPLFSFAPKTAGFHEQIVARLAKLARSKGLKDPQKIWAVWPYNGTAQQPENGRFIEYFTGQEIVDALLNPKKEVLIK